MKLYNCSFYKKNLIFIHIYIYIYIYITTKILNRYDNCKQNRTRYIMIDQNSNLSSPIEYPRVREHCDCNLGPIEIHAIVFNWGSLWTYLNMNMCIFKFFMCILTLDSAKLLFIIKPTINIHVYIYIYIYIYMFSKIIFLITSQIWSITW